MHCASPFLAYTARVSGDFFLLPSVSLTSNIPDTFIRCLMSLDLYLCTPQRREKGGRCSHRRAPAVDLRLRPILRLVDSRKILLPDSPSPKFNANCSHVPYSSGHNLSDRPSTLLSCSRPPLSGAVAVVCPNLDTLLTSRWSCCNDDWLYQQSTRPRLYPR